VLEARTNADQAFARREFEQALSGYACVLGAQRDHLDARLRVADCLLALGQVQRAAVVYTTFARQAASEGQPLRALVAIKILSALEPLLAPLVSAVAELYCVDGRVGRGARPVPSDESLALGEAQLALLALQGEALVEQAEALGKDAPAPREVPALPPIPLLSELSKQDFVSVFETMTLVRKGAGEPVLVQGDAGMSFFLAARGDFEIFRDEPDGARTHLTSLHEGALFGEMALLSKSPRTAHVVTTSDADLLELHVGALGQLSDGAGAIARALAKFTRERLVTNLINTARLFRPLTRSQRIDLVRRFVAHEVAAQTDLIREGEPGSGLFVVLQGAVDVWKRVGDEKVLLATLGASDVFGEISLLNAAPASATVTAAQRSTVLFLAREYVERLMESVPELATYLGSLGDERALDTRMWLDNAGGSAAEEDFSLDIDIEVDLT
jgi:CRP-like cAMP-binding protein